MALKKVKWSLLIRQGAKETWTCYQSSPWRVLGAQQDKSSPGGIEIFRKGFICLHRALGNVLAQALPVRTEKRLATTSIVTSWQVRPVWNRSPWEWNCASPWGLMRYRLMLSVLSFNLCSGGSYQKCCHRGISCRDCRWASSWQTALSYT